uniref:Uncharacterized protein n=1 Tax=Caenorhabditis japonica TaxID=281687 RepID=A0A8R1DSK7_CAEJA
MGEQLRKLNRANRNSEEKLERLVKRKESLELDIARLADATMRAEPEVGTELLNSIEEPMDMDVIYGEAFRKKMCHLKVLLNEIIVRTSINEKAMCKEIGHQEGEFENRLKEAIYGRARANRKVEEAQAKCEVMIREQANLYEDVRELEENLEKYGASRWLLNVEKRRVADILDRTKREPKSGIECRKAYVVPITESSSSSIEDLMTSSASLTHEHVDSDQFDVEHCSERIPELPVHCNPPSSVMEVPNVQIPPHQHHKEGCPKRKSSQLHPIPHSASLISQKVIDYFVISDGWIYLFTKTEKVLEVFMIAVYLVFHLLFIAFPVAFCSSKDRNLVRNEEKVKDVTKEKEEDKKKKDNELVEEADSPPSRRSRPLPPEPIFPITEEGSTKPDVGLMIAMKIDTNSDRFRRPEIRGFVVQKDKSVRRLTDNSRCNEEASKKRKKMQKDLEEQNEKRLKELKEKSEAEAKAKSEKSRKGVGEKGATSEKSKKSDRKSSKKSSSKKSSRSDRSEKKKSDRKVVNSKKSEKPKRTWKNFFRRKKKGSKEKRIKQADIPEKVEEVVA